MHNQHIKHGAEASLDAFVWENLPSLLRLAHLCLTPSIFKDLTFFVRSWQTKSSHPTWLHIPRLKIRVLPTTSAPTHPDPNLGFFPDRRMDGCFLQAKVAERGRSAAPRISRAHMHVTTQSLGPQANVCGDFCYACAFISHVWSSFRGCQASKRLSAWGADFMNKKHHMHMQRCCGIAGFI